MLFVAKLGEFLSKGGNKQSWDADESKIVCLAKAFPEEVLIPLLVRSLPLWLLLSGVSACHHAGESNTAAHFAMFLKHLSWFETTTASPVP